MKPFGKAYILFLMLFAFVCFCMALRSGADDIELREGDTCLAFDVNHRSCSLWTDQFGAHWHRTWVTSDDGTESVVVMSGDSRVTNDEGHIIRANRIPADAPQTAPEVVVYDAARADYLGLEEPAVIYQIDITYDGGKIHITGTDKLPCPHCNGTTRIRIPYYGTDITMHSRTSVRSTGQLTTELEVLE